MSTKNHNSRPTDLSSVLEMLTDFQAGNFSKKLPQNDDSNLKPLIDKMNETAKFFEAQALAQVQAGDELASLILRKAELRTIFETMSDGLLIQDSTGKIIRFNQAALSLLGQTEDQLLGRTSMDPGWKAIREDGTDFPGLEGLAMVALRTGEKVVGVVMGIQLPSGVQNWFRINTTPYESKGDPVHNQAAGRHVLTTFTNITERKQAEEALHRSKAEVRTQLREIEQIYNYTPIGLLILDREYRFQRINERMAEINGFSIAHHFGKSIDEIAPDLAGFLKETYRPIFERGEPVLNVEIHGKTRRDSDHQRDWIGNYFPLKSETGEVIGLIGAVLEITERKNAEAELVRAKQRAEESEARLITAQGVAKVGSWELDLKTNEVIWTEELYKMYGFDPTLPVPPYTEHFKLFTPESWEQLSASLSLTRDQGIPYELELTTIRKDGNHGWMLVRGEAVFDEKKNIIGLMGVVQDITEKKILEREKERILKHLNYALDASGDGIWDWTPADGKTVYSKAWIEMLGYKVGELASLASEWSDRLHPDDVEWVFAAINKVTQTPENGDTLKHEYRFRNKAGDYLWILNKAKVVERNKKGEASRVVGTHTNITALVVAKEENRLILDTVGFGVWKFNPVTQDLVWDKSMYNLFGISPEEFNGHYQAWESSLTPEAKAEAVTELDLALKGEKEFNHTFAINYKDTGKRYIGGKGQVIRNKNGSPAMMYGVNWDRTKEVELQKNLEEEKMRSFHNSKLAAVGRLSAGIGHEINNPLAIISGQISIVGDILKGSENVSAEVVERLNKMERAVSRIGNIVKTLRTFARSDEALSDFDPFELVFETVNIFKDLYLKDEVALTLTGNTKASFIHGDRGRVQQVLVNLISNAKDATVGVPNRKIDVSVSYEEGHIKLGITDNGCGIPDEIKEKIFEPFFTTKEINNGTGIGLSLVSTIIKEHEGKLELNSKIGAGSTFTIFFPVTFGQSVMLVDAQNGSMAAIQEKTHCNVLIVDDEEDLRDIFQFMLSKICSNVVVAESAKAGYDIVAQGKIDIVFSDIKMPVHDGFDFFRMIRQNKKIIQPKFVFLTGGVQMSEEELQIIKFQTDGLLTKPLVRDDVSKKIRELFPERVS